MVFGGFFFFLGALLGFVGRFWCFFESWVFFSLDWFGYVVFRVILR